MAIYIRDVYVADQYLLTTCDATLLETLWISLVLNRATVLIGVMYRPPTCSLTETVTQCHAILSEVTPIFDNIMITGDVNVNMLKPDNLISECFDSYGLAQVVDEPTRVTQTTATLLDPIFINSHDMIKAKGIINSDFISDHSLVFCEVSLASSESAQKMYTYRCFKHFNELAFHEDMRRVSWDDIYYINNIDNKITFLTDNLLSIFNVHAPIRTVRLSRAPAPWLTDALKIILKERDKAFRKYKKDKTIQNWNNYKNLRNFALTSVRREKAAYLKYVNSQDATTLWKRLKLANVLSRARPELPSNLHNPTDINDHFLSAFSKASADAELINYFQTNRHSQSRLEFRLSSPEEVNTIIRGLKSNAAGLDDISLVMLKLSLPFLSNHFTHIINTCLEQGYFPAIWRTAIICPIPKVNSPTSINDLRPISLLPVLSKVLERVVYQQLISYVGDSGILPSHQSGFRPGHGTATALLYVNNLIVEGLDSGMATALILLDYSRAFDCVDHTLLLAKLYYFGLTDIALSFFRNYLEGRRQLVRLHSGVSGVGDVTSGVPQGSILGPLLFILYTFDMSKITSYSRIHSYADDTQLICTFHPSQYDEIEANLNADLQQISKYSSKHNLNLNAKKTQVLLIAPEECSNFLKDYINIQLNGQPLGFTDIARNLGILFDNKLRFSQHISNLSKKSYVALKVLYANKHILNFKVRKKLCEAYILSNLSYCITMYYPCLTYDDKRRLQKIQNNCCRFVYGLKKYDHISEKIMRMHWLKVSYLFQFLLLVFIYKLLKTSTPIYLRSALVFRSDVHQVVIRLNTLTMPQYKKTIFQRGFVYNSVKHYNKFRTYFTCTSLAMFRKEIKTVLLDEQRNIALA